MLVECFWAEAHRRLSEEEEGVWDSLRYILRGRACFRSKMKGRANEEKEERRREGRKKLGFCLSYHLTNVLSFMQLTDMERQLTVCGMQQEKCSSLHSLSFHDIKQENFYGDFNIELMDFFFLFHTILSHDNLTRLFPVRRESGWNKLVSSC